MSDLCSECKLVITALDSVSCDSCSRLFHKKVCSGLNASEIKVMELKGARQLNFFCPECLSGLKMVPTLIKAVEELRQEIDDLKKTPVMQTPPNIPVPSNTPVLNYNEADIFVELQERQNRANNLMIFNVPEGNDSEPDSDQVKKIISILSDTNSPQPRVLQTLRMELYSGIGGMHMALQESGVPGTVKAAIEINPTANSIYKHNFPETKLLNLNIQGLTADLVNKLNVDTILMSPPCQPFTRNGKQQDLKDARTDSFQHILTLLPHLSLKQILIENVKGFEGSKMRDLLVQTLKDNSFCYQEFVLSPSQFGVPNSRSRYYCIAKKGKFNFDTQKLLERLPGFESDLESFEIQDIIEDDVNFADYSLNEKILSKRLGVLDICYKTSKRSCCFTKAYGRFIEGTGSVYTENNEEEVLENIKKLHQMQSDSEKYLELAESLNLRFFTAKEISRLMCFPETFAFPDNLTNRQKYMVLGNSINVKVVSELIKLFN
ncbi:unnamed protein product [Ceutorhynchus assimilis]|uniref:Uncharacterized protein n=1 Tax=Ceutorhynchus assimilis TaxID=467358 RepID=A0A9N9MK40_9CUCU|nr:unnamed protein product [Ceutorhynchus assimilis]